MESVSHVSGYYPHIFIPYSERELCILLSLRNIYRSFCIVYGACLLCQQNAAQSEYSLTILSVLVIHTSVNVFFCYFVLMYFLLL